MSDSPLALFAESLARFQAQMPHIGKDQTAQTGSYGYSYAGLEDIAPKVLALLAEQGLSWTAAPKVIDGAFVLVSSLLHTGGHREPAEYPLPDPSKANPQQIGSAITYARRYSFTALTGVTPGGEDDDGAKALESRAAPAREAGPEPVEPRTDAAWFTDWQGRVAQAQTVAELPPLWKEVAAKARAGQVHPEDMEAVASPLYRERQDELRQAKP
jgi:ERF superfamily